MSRGTWSLVLALVCSLAADAWGQAGRLSRTQPFLVSRAPAPAATIRQLRFAQEDGTLDGTLALYSAGDDKLVRKWVIEERGGRVEVREAAKITWPVFRDTVGVIYALDAVRDGEGTRLAFGGYGLKRSQVNVLYTDARHDANQAARLLSQERLSRKEVVISLDLHYDAAAGRCLLAVGHDRLGYVPIWTIPRGDAAAAIEQRRAKLASLVAPLHVAFSRDGKLLAAAGPDGKGKSRIEVFDVQGATLRTQRELPARPNHGAVAFSGDSYVVGTTRGLIVQDSETRFPGKLINAVATSAGSEVVLARSPVELSDNPKEHQILLLDLKRGNATPLPGTSFISAPDAVAITPDATWVAAAGMAREHGPPLFQICLWKKTPAGYRLAATAPGKQAAGNVVASIAHVALRKDKTSNDVVGFSWGSWDYRGTKRITRQFSLAGRGALGDWRGGKPQDEGYVLAGPGRQFIFKRSDEKTDRELGFDQKSWVGPLKGDGNGQARCYAWVRHPRAANKWLLAVGYDRGILIWDWEKLESLKKEFKQGQFADTRPAILRSFYGHYQQVNSLAASTDGRTLISGSMDGTICAWRMDDGSLAKDEMGVTLRWNGGQRKFFVAADPVPGSPAWEADFRQGELIDNFMRYGKALEWHEALKEEPAGSGQYRFINVPGEELQVVVRRNAKPVTLVTVCSRDPMWTLYPLRNGEWFLHTPAGFYLKSLDLKPGSLGWLVNLNGTPAVRLNQRRLGASLLQPEFVFQPLLSLDHLQSKALRTARRLGEDRNPFNLIDDFLLQRLTVGAVLDKYKRKKFLTEDPLKDRPSRPVFDYEFKTVGGKRTVTVRVRSASTAPARLQELRVNGWRITPNDLVGKTADSITAVLRDDMLRSLGPNDLVALAAVNAGGRAHQYSDVYALGQRNGRIVRPAIHFLGIGNNTPYKNGPGGTVVEDQALAKLRYAESGIDAVGDKIVAAFQRARGRFNQRLTGPKAKKDDLRQQIDRLAEIAKPDDLAIVMLSGHGEVDKVSGQFSFLASDSRTNDLSTGVTGKDLSGWLPRLPCRCLLILDTCHSGSASVDQQLGDLLHLSVGPLILTACSGDEQALEPDELGFGVFTKAVLETLDDVQAARDGTFSVERFCNVVRGKADKIVRERVIGATGSITPKLFPSLTFRDYAEFDLRAN